MKLLILGLFFSLSVQAKEIRVVVFDTGVKDNSGIKMCDNGKLNKDFTGKGLTDVQGHGTNVSGLVDFYAGKSKYCQIIVKWYHTRSPYNDISYIMALQYLETIKFDVLNLSLSGGAYAGSLFEIERKAIVNLLNKGVKIFVASGNDSADLDKGCVVYPACHDQRNIIVGAFDVPQGNKGKVVDIYESGFQKTALGVTQTGTSQATAVATGKYVKSISNR